MSQLGTQTLSFVLTWDSYCPPRPGAGVWTGVAVWSTMG